MHAPARERKEVVGGERHLVAPDQLGLGRAAAAHRHDDDVPAVLLEVTRDVRRHGGLPHALAGAHDRQRGGAGDGLGTRRTQHEVGAAILSARAERDAREREAVGGREHGLVRQVDDDLGREARERFTERGATIGGLHDRHAVDLGGRGGVDLLGAADERRPLQLVLLPEAIERVAHHRGVVLTVDERDRVPHAPSPSPGSSRCRHVHSRLSCRSKSATTSGSSKGCLRITRTRSRCSSMML